ncbi:hypothetical protein HK104_002221 [Borealophlyctis nickersoniae]|nr:hypothetical protein HK104_002221 [Borealophlyctis nickersoniae]
MHITLKSIIYILATTLLTTPITLASPQKDASTVKQPTSNAGSSAPKNILPNGSVNPNRGADGRRNNGSFCNGKTLRDGSQNRDGSCSPTVMGDIPRFDRMVSTLIVSPQDGVTMRVNQPFNITVDVSNMQLGAFDDPLKEYYLTPQTLNRDGKIIGHIHVVAQKMSGRNNANRALDPRTFAFFKGLDQAPFGNGRKLTVAVTNKNTGQPGLQEPGKYRICSMTGGRSHAPTVMPVAQRGAQDDCIRINIRR